MKAVLLSLLIAGSLLQACTKKDKSAKMPGCGAAVEINSIKYNNMVSHNYAFTNAVIDGDCLTITFGASGCSGSTWVTELFDSGTVDDYTPLQRYLRMKLTNTELCAAVPVKSVSFDIRPLRVLGKNSVELNLDGWPGTLVYQY
jgi:hypothetical protein